MYVHTVDNKSDSTPIYFDKKNLYRFNALTQSSDRTSEEYLGDHLKERLRNR